MISDILKKAKREEYFAVFTADELAKNEKRMFEEQRIDPVQLSIFSLKAQEQSAKSKTKETKRDVIGYDHFIRRVGEKKTSKSSEGGSV